MAKETGIREMELRSGLRDGGQIQNVVAVVRQSSGNPEFVAYLRLSWKLGYHIFRVWRGAEERCFRTADAVLQLAWRYDFPGPVVIYRAGAPELGRFRGILAIDGGTRE